jgi:hypothetical protein
VLCSFADALNASFLPLVGGAALAFTVIKLLFPLCTATETAVRTRAVKSLNSLIAELPGAASSGGGAERGFGASEEWATLKGYLVTLTGALEAPGAAPAELDEDGSKKDEPWFPSKLSACQLYPYVYGCLPKDGFSEEKTTLLENFAALADDEMPMVRATAATALAGLAPNVSAASFKQHLLPVFKLVSEDRSDVVREMGVKSMTKYLGSLPPTSAAADADAVPSLLAEVVPLWCRRWWRCVVVVAMCPQHIHRPAREATGAGEETGRKCALQSRVGLRAGDKWSHAAQFFARRGRVMATNHPLGGR